VLLEQVEHRNDFLLDELLGRLCNQSVLFGEFLRRQHAFGARRFDEPGPALEQCRFGCCHC
jgi:hypothetical protein